MALTAQIVRCCGGCERTLTGLLRLALLPRCSECAQVAANRTSSSKGLACRMHLPGAVLALICACPCPFVLRGRRPPCTPATGRPWAPAHWPVAKSCALPWLNGEAEGLTQCLGTSSSMQCCEHEMHCRADLISEYLFLPPPDDPAGFVCHQVAPHCEHFSLAAGAA